MRIALVLVLATACGRSSPSLQPPTPWAKRVNASEALETATHSKALRCLLPADASTMQPLHYDVSPDLFGAMVEQNATRGGSTYGEAASLALDAGALESVRRLVVYARAHQLGVDSDVADAADSALPVSATEHGIVDLARAGRLDDARQGYAAFDARGGFGPAAKSRTVFVLGALGRYADAHALIAAEPANKRVALDGELIAGLLYASSPADSLDDATAALMHDTGGDPDEYRVSLYTAAAEMRAAGYASHARSLRHYLISYVTSSGDQALLRDKVAPEVFAAGGDDELRDVDAVADKLFSDGHAALAWSRAYYRGELAEALAHTRDERDLDVRRGHLLRLWARAASEGFDHDAISAIDDLACAPRR